MKKFLAVLEADAKEIGVVAFSAFIGALVVAPGSPIKDVVVAAAITAGRAAVGRLALILGKIGTLPAS